MKKKLSKIIVVLCAFCLLVGMIPISIFASTPTFEYIDSNYVDKGFYNFSNDWFNKTDNIALFDSIASQNEGLVNVEFVSNGIEFNYIIFSHDSSGNRSLSYAANGYIYKVLKNGKWVNDNYRMIYIIGGSDFSHDYGYIRSDFVDLLDTLFNCSKMGLTEFPSYKYPYEIDFTNIHYTNVLVGALLHVKSTNFNVYLDNGYGMIVTPEFVSRFNGISFINYYDTQYEEPNSYNYRIRFELDGQEVVTYGDDYPNDSSALQDSYIRFPASSPLWLISLFADSSDCFIYGYPYYVAPQQNGNYISYSSVLDNDINSKQFIDWPVYIADTDSLNGSSLSSCNSLTFDNEGRLCYADVLYGGAPFAKEPLGESFIVPFGASPSDCVVDSATYYAFRMRAYPNSADGFYSSDTYTFEFEDKEHTFLYPFNSFNALTRYACNCSIDGVYYEYVLSKDGGYYFYDSLDSDDDEYLVFYPLEDLVGKIIVFPKYSIVNPAFYQFVFINSIILNGGTLDEGYQAGYTDGYNAGHDKGYNEGYNIGDTAGYNRGYDTGYTNGYKVGSAIGGDSGLVGSLLSAPGSAFDSLVIYESNGISVSIWDVFCTMLCAVLMIYFLKMFAGG